MVKSVCHKWVKDQITITIMKTLLRLEEYKVTELGYLTKTFTYSKNMQWLEAIVNAFVFEWTGVGKHGLHRY